MVLSGLLPVAFGLYPQIRFEHYGVRLHFAGQSHCDLRPEFHDDPMVGQVHHAIHAVLDQ